MNIIEKFETQNNCFGTVTWNMCDLNTALAEQEIPTTKENLETAYDALDYYMPSFRQTVIKAGWDYINNVIRDLVECGDLKTNGGD